MIGKLLSAEVCNGGSTTPTGLAEVLQECYDFFFFFFFCGIKPFIECKCL